jgi:hypothetical protein
VIGFDMSRPKSLGYQNFGSMMNWRSRTLPVCHSLRWQGAVVGDRVERRRQLKEHGHPHRLPDTILPNSVNLLVP